jgi:hypothetical protein
MNDDMPIDETRDLKDYQCLSALFQFYLELVFKAFTFALGIAGGVSAFVLGKDVPDRRLAAFGLLLPAVLCIGMGFAFLRAVHSSRELNSAPDAQEFTPPQPLHPMPRILQQRSRGLECFSLYVGFFSRGFSSSYSRAAEDLELHGAGRWAIR